MTKCRCGWLLGGKDVAVDSGESTGASGNVKPQILAPQQVEHDEFEGSWRGREVEGPRVETSRSVAAYAYAMPMPESANLAKCSVGPPHFGWLPWVHGPINCVSLWCPSAKWAKRNTQRDSARDPEIQSSRKCLPKILTQLYTEKKIRYGSNLLLKMLNWYWEM